MTYAPSMSFILWMIFLLVIILYVTISFIRRWQKTRSTQQRRAHTGSRTRQLSMQGEPTIYVSPANLPPPPKYEAMAPPSYDEVMGLQYPGFQQGQQPITQPLTQALAQGTPTNDIPAVHTVTANNSNGIARCTEIGTNPPAIATVINEERRPSVVRA